jgi:glycosyltransferase involved in cell wall biosynthesis
MKVLWITNILLPDICEYLGKEPPVLGGWMNASLSAIIGIDSSVSIAVASIYDGNKLIEKEIKGVTYYCLPNRNGRRPTEYDSNFEIFWLEIKRKLEPDVVHIHGSEFLYGLAYLKTCGNNNAVLSIQGCVSAIRRYALGGIEYEDWKKNRSFHNKVKLINPRKQIIDGFDKMSRSEAEYFMKLNYIIGRTDWDRIHALAINPKLHYFFCNETLRSAFDGPKWDKSKCVQHRIFLSQGSTPIKGLHIVIKALPYVLRYYPDTEVYVAGSSPIHTDWKRCSTYGNLLLSLLKETGSVQKVHFTGELDEEGMVKMYLSSSVFVCPSSIENSPNSLGEAQLLGVPCVASYVGGIPNMIEDGKTGLLYRFEEYEMLADKICRIFGDASLMYLLSANSRITAIERHNWKINALQTIGIYSNIIGE